MSARSFELNKRRQGNVTVTNTSDELAVQLHNTVVAHFCRHTSVVTLSSGGYRTPTTKTAINRFLSLIHVSSKVSQVKGTWYIAGQEFVDGFKIKIL